MAWKHARFVALAAGLVAVNIGAWWWFAGRSATVDAVADSGTEGSGGEDANTSSHTPPQRALATLERVLLMPELDRLVVEIGAPEQWSGEEAEGETPEWHAQLVIDPPLRGEWVPSGRDRAEYRFAAPPEPGSSITVRVRDDARDFLAADRAADVPGVQLLKAKITEMTRDGLALALHVDRPVDPDWVWRAVRVRGPDGRLLSFEAIPGEAMVADRHTVRLARPQGGRVRVDIGGAVQTVNLPVRFTALGTSWASAVSGEVTDVTLRFTDALAEAVPFGAIDIMPRVADLRMSADDSELTMTGSFEPETHYRVTLPGALASRAGERLESDLSVTFVVHPPSPELSFPDGSGLLTPGGHGRLTLESVGVREVELTLYRVHDDLLVPFLRGLSASDASRRVARETFVVTPDAEAGRHPRTRSSIDLAALLGDARGLFVVEARAADHGWSRARAVVARTDLAVAVCTDGAGALAWVSDVGSAVPRAGVIVRAMGPSGRVLAEGVTDDAGLVQLPVQPSHPDGPLTAVLVRDGEDALLERVDRGGAPLTEMTSGGRAAPGGFDVLLYAERGVHRPGETLRMTALVRTATGAVPDDLPLRFTLEGPDGRVIGEAHATAARSRGGFAHADLPTLSAGATGVHRVLVRVDGSDRVLAAVDAPVEPFVPASLLVSGDLTQLQSDRARATVRAERIGGRAAAGLRVRMQAELRPQRPVFSAYERYLFGEAPSDSTRALQAFEGTLNDEGMCTAEWTLPDDMPAAAVLLTATVFEPGGRSRSTVLAPMTLLRDEVHVGLAVDSTDRTPTRAGSVHVVTVDALGAPVTTDATWRLRIERVRWDWGMEVVRGERIWRSIERRIEVYDAALTDVRETDKPHGFAFDIQPLPPGEYVLTLLVGEARASTAITISPEGIDAERSREPDRVDVTLAGAAPTAGGMAELLVRTPFAGTALITIEDERVHAAHVRELPEGTSRVELTVPQALRGGTFVSVLLVRGIDREAESWRPHRAAGSMRLPLDVSAHRLELALDLPKRARVGESVTAHVRAEGDIPVDEPLMLHLWAVDEGVIRAAHHVPVDPLAHFLGDRRHRVRHFDARRRLLPDHRGLLSERTIGGDRDERARRRGPETAFTDSVVIFHQAIPLSASGEGSVTFEMPDLDGSLRVRAVVAAGDRYGAAEQEIVADHPLRLIAHAPRVLAPGDRAMMTVRVVAGNSPLGESVTFSVAGAGAEDEEAGAETMTFALLPGEERLLHVPLAAVSEGMLSCRLVASAGVIRAERLIEIPVRSALPVVQMARQLHVHPGTPLTIAASKDPAVERHLRVMASPLPMLRDLCDQLIDYPHGCAEQTVHRLVALRAVERFDAARAQQSAVLIEEGLARLLGMQRPGGGIGYWPGAEEDPACTILAALLVAGEEASGDRAAFAESLRGALQRMVERAGSGPGADTLRAHALRALSALGAPNGAWTEVVAHRSADLDGEALAQLGIAAHGAGRGELAHRLADQAIACFAAAGDRSPLKDDPFRPGMRTAMTAAAALDALLARIRPDDPMRERIAIVAEESLGPFLSTVDSAAVLAILTDRYGQGGSRSEPDSASSSITSATSSTSAWSASLLRIEQSGAALPAEPMFASWREGRSVRISAHAPLELVLEEGAAPLRVQVMDASPARQVLSDNAEGGEVPGLVLVRRWTTESGEPCAWPLQVESGTRMIVELELRSSSRAGIRDVAVVDPLPGGFEIEHPGLAGTAPGGGVHLAGAQRGEIHDDRMVIFADLAARPVTIRYAVRAVVPGRYALPPAEAQAMYDPAKRAIAAGGVVEVLAR